MLISDLSKVASATCVQELYSDTSVASVYSSDLLSDVLSHACDCDVLVTVQAHANTVAVAVARNIRAIIICNGRSVPPEMKASARENRIAIFVTNKNQFETCAAIALSENTTTYRSCAAE